MIFGEQNFPLLHSRSYHIARGSNKITSSPCFYDILSEIVTALEAEFCRLSNYGKFLLPKQS